jgi:hypothetical protein
VGDVAVHEGSWERGEVVFGVQPVTRSGLRPRLADMPKARVRYMVPQH